MVEGGLFASEDLVRVVTRLVSVPDGVSMWNHTFERPAETCRHSIRTGSGYCQSPRDWSSEVVSNARNRPRSPNEILDGPGSG